MVVHDFDVRRARIALRPLETDSPAIIDSYAELPFAISRQRLEAVSRQRRQIADGRCGIKPIELELRRTFYGGERLYTLTRGEVPRPLVAVADDHVSE